ncbi:anthranilate synthase component II [Halomarina litorea]|uniref:anthranilate synthase component II n=1 Tax=Halomarina litorea TaxID=2961595 RepID=UPI0020C5440B|nr:aminodeoxychorismate/anthranilate synthase component II [Halomarina sp. BCD28]
MSHPNSSDATPTILVVDNYDSFAYNLVQFVGEALVALDVAAPHAAVVVERNDAVDRAAIRAMDPDGIVVSPGPGTPESAGVSMDVFSLDVPTLGVCLGHQALCAASGARVGHAPEVVHGKPSTVRHDGRGIFAGLPDQLEVGRYHSLCATVEDLPDELAVTATTVGADDGTLMAVRHRHRPHVGVQFHPESILTTGGRRMVRNFCAAALGRDADLRR